MMTNEYDILKALLREDFKSFVMKVFSEISPNAEYSDNWHIDVICCEIEKIIYDLQKKLIINIPPRSLKSIICSVALPAYILGKNPKAAIICVSYSDSLASKFAADTRRIMECAWYKELFPLTRISQSKRATNDFETTQGGGRYATSVEGTLTGRGADYIIVDDPIKPDDSNSDLVREKVNYWYGSTLYSRLNDKRTGKTIVIMQRVHQFDFTGYLLETDKEFKLIKLPAIAEEREFWETENFITGKKKIYIREIGEVLHSARENKVMIDLTRATVGSYVFASQYQQNPASRGASIIQPDWLQYYSVSEISNLVGEYRFDSVFMSWDTAYKIGAENDYSSCIVMARTRKGILLLLDVYRGKLEFPALLKKIKTYRDEIYNKYKYFCKGEPLIIIENVGSGMGLVDSLKREGIYVKKVQPETDKATRLKNVSHLIENGTCLFPDNKPIWWADFERELLSFPNTRHDDQCDAFSQALAHGASKPRFRMGDNLYW